MPLQTIEFVVFPHDQSWKIYRDDELVAVYPSQDLAIADAEGFTEQLSRRGRAARLQILAPDDAAAFIARTVELW